MIHRNSHVHGHIWMYLRVCLEMGYTPFCFFNRDNYDKLWGFGVAYFQTNPYIEHTSIADWDGLSHFSWWFFLHLCLKMLRNVKTSEKTTRSVRTLGLRTLKIPPWHIFSHNNYQHHFLTRITISLDTLWSPDVAGWNFPPHLVGWVPHLSRHFSGISRW